MADQCGCGWREIIVRCAVCSIEKTAREYILCQTHRVPLICGKCRFVCDACIDAGWISLAGTGGGDALYNPKLNLELVRGQLRVLNRESSSSEEDES